MSFADFDTFIDKPNLVRRYGNWLAELSPVASDGSALTIAGQSDGVIRACTRLEGYRSDTPTRKQYLNRLQRGLELKTSLWSSTESISIGGASLPSEAELILVNTDGYYDQFSPYNGVLWDGRQGIVRFGAGYGYPGRNSYLPYSQFRTFNFEMGEPVFSLGIVKVPLYGKDRRFDFPLTELVYRGTGYTLDFAAGAYSSHGTPAKLDLTGDMTYEGWTNIDNFSANRIQTGWIQGATRWPFNIVVLSTGKLSFNYTHSGGTGVTHSMTAVMSAGRWYHTAIIIDGTSGTFILYDATTGIEIVEAFTTAAATRDANVSGTFQISRNSPTTSMVGRLDEQRFWSEARTLSEIRAFRHGELDVVPSALVGYFKHNDASGTTTSDSGSGTAADGTLNGTTTWYHSCEGSSALAGKTKPDAFGRTEYQEPFLVDEVNQIYQVASRGAVSAIQPLEGMNAITSDGADISSEKTFINVAVTAGKYRTNLATGKFKLGSAPTQPLTASIKGYVGSGYIDDKANVIRGIITSRGPNPLTDPDDLNTSSFTALGTADNSVQGIYTREPVTIREVIDLIAGPGVWWGFSVDDTLFTVEQWAIGAVADFEIPSSRIISIEPIDDPIRYWRVLMKYGKIRPHSETEINATIKSSFPIIYQRGRSSDGWSEAAAEDYDTHSDHNRAREVSWETAIQWPESLVAYEDPVGRDSALREARRVLAILNAGYVPWRLVLDPYGLRLSLSDTIAPVIKIGSNYRMGFDGTRLLSILGIEVDPDTWQVAVTALG